ncbi:hypothetical protein [Kushneria indalinina]|uniref:Uncharacterized protein n=1 Tax=Kushneria indalinina DSM 14324 TaxID=1122140 RepID=A0A3D9E0V9_9GAMM|nr:hypothetical protein [Kushneria indalinina]REC96668.1 hypothetical protein C8D72_0013 [Kushneria indalinina DSM 14324]
MSDSKKQSFSVIGAAKGCISASWKPVLSIVALGSAFLGVAYNAEKVAGLVESLWGAWETLGHAINPQDTLWLPWLLYTVGALILLLVGCVISKAVDAEASFSSLGGWMLAILFLLGLFLHFIAGPAYPGALLQVLHFIEFMGLGAFGCVALNVACSE